MSWEGLRLGARVQERFLGGEEFAVSSSSESVYLDSEYGGHGGYGPCRCGSPLNRFTISLVGQKSVQEPVEPDEPLMLLLGDGVDEEEDNKQPLRRASSLKSAGEGVGGGEKKIVRFADVLGLDLADVRTFLDDVPKVPRSAFRDLGVEPSPSPVGSPFGGFTTPSPQRAIVACFPQPAGQRDFRDRLSSQQVCLESATLTDPALAIITGLVRVSNLGFHKQVWVRYSSDAWTTSQDTSARYVSSSPDSSSDLFSFTLFAHCLKPGDKLEFALRYRVNDTDFWDNNHGSNYSFLCQGDGTAPTRPNISAYVPSSLTYQTWASFY